MLVVGMVESEAAEGDSQSHFVGEAGRSNEVELEGNSMGQQDILVLDMRGGTAGVVQDKNMHIH